MARLTDTCGNSSASRG